MANNITRSSIIEATQFKSTVDWSNVATTIRGTSSAQNSIIPTELAVSDAVSNICSIELLGTLTSWSNWAWYTVQLSQQLQNFRFLILELRATTQSDRRVFYPPMFVSEVLNGNTNSEIWVDGYFTNTGYPLSIALKGASSSATTLSVMVTNFSSSGDSDWKGLNLLFWGIL